MAKDNKPSQSSNVVPMAVCPAEKCGKKATRAEFCNEHFVWFKEGLIARSGEKAKDFDKKYQAYLMRQKKSA